MNTSLKIIAGSLAGAGVLSAMSLALAQSPNFADAPVGHPISSADCIGALAAMDAAMLSDFDAMAATRKDALEAHKDALTAAAAITDDAKRQEAVRKAHDDMHAATKAFMESHKNDHQAAMDAVKAACGDGGRHRFGMMRGLMMGMGPMVHHGPK